MSRLNWIKTHLFECQSISTLERAEKKKFRVEFFDFFWQSTTQLKLIKE